MGSVTFDFYAPHIFVVVVCVDGKFLKMVQTIREPVRTILLLYGFIFWLNGFVRATHQMISNVTSSFLENSVVPIKFETGCEM